MEDVMAKTLGYVAILSLIVSLVLTIVTIWMKTDSAIQYLELTKVLLSWQVIAGGLAIGGASTFKSDISEFLRKKR